MNDITALMLGGIGILITLYYSWHTKKIADEQMMKQLFTEFNQRYNLLNNSLIEIERDYPSIELLNASSRAKVLKQNVIDYFSLCAEEFYWYYHKRRIDKLIWNSWHTGMNYWYKNVPTIKSLWEIEIKSNGRKSYYITDEEFFVN